MELWPVVIVFLAIAIILLLISFFVKEDESPLLNEVADFTMQITEELHQLRTKVTQLEKSIQETGQEEKELPIKKINAVTKKHVLTLHQQGKTYDEIAEQLELPETTVQLLIDNHHDQLSKED